MPLKIVVNILKSSSNFMKFVKFVDFYLAASILKEKKEVRKQMNIWYTRLAFGVGYSTLNEIEILNEKII